MKVFAVAHSLGSSEQPTARRQIPARPELGVAFILAVLAVAVNLRPVLTVVGPVTDLIRTDTGLSTTALGLLASVPVVCMGLGSLMSPWLNRLIGMDNSVSAALISLALTTLIRSFIPGAGLWIGTVGIGLSIGVLNAGLPPIIKRDFPSKASSITGLYSATLTLSAGLASGVAVPIAGANSWQIALGVWAVLVLLGLAAWLWSVHARRAIEPALSEVVAAVINDDGAAAVKGSSQPTAHEPTPAVWTVPLAWVVTFFMGLQSFLFYTFVQWLPEINQANGFTAEAAGWHMTEFQISGLIATLLVTAIQRERQDQRLATAATGTLWFAGTLGLLLAPGATVVWVAVMGAASGASFYLSLAFIGTRTRNPRRASELSGMTQSIGYIIAAFGPLIAGALSSLGWDAVLYLGLSVSAALVILGFIAGAPRKI